MKSKSTAVNSIMGRIAMPAHDTVELRAELARDLARLHVLTLDWLDNRIELSRLHPKPGSTLARTEIVTIRLTPKLKYLADIAARKHRRTLSSFIEWALAETIKDASEGVDS